MREIAVSASEEEPCRNHSRIEMLHESFESCVVGVRELVHAFM